MPRSQQRWFEWLVGVLQVYLRERALDKDFFFCGERVRSVGMGRSQPLTPRGLGEEKNRDPLSVCQESAEKAKAIIWRARYGGCGCHQNILFWCNVELYALLLHVYCT